MFGISTATEANSRRMNTMGGMNDRLSPMRKSRPEGVINAFKSQITTFS